MPGQTKRERLPSLRGYRDSQSAKIDVKRETLPRELLVINGRKAGDLVPRYRER